MTESIEPATDEAVFDPTDLVAMEREARTLWNERQADCATFGADLPLPFMSVRVDVLATALSRLTQAEREGDDLKAATEATNASLLEVDAVFHEMMGYVGKMALSDYGALNRASIFLSRARAALQAPQP